MRPEHNGRQVGHIALQGVVNIRVGFCQFCPQSPAYVYARPVANSAGAPFHSHSIVSGTYKRLKLKHFSSGHAGLTVTSTAKNFRLSAIDSDRCRKGQGSLAAMACDWCFIGQDFQFRNLGRTAAGEIKHPEPRPSFQLTTDIPLPGSRAAASPTSAATPGDRCPRNR